MTSLSAYLLVSHGSRDNRSQIALERLAYLVKQQLDDLYSHRGSILSNRPEYQAAIKTIATKTRTIINKSSSHQVETATLELASCPLHERIQQMAKQVQTTGANQIKLIPLFLFKGVHVEEDIPEQIEMAKTYLPPSCQLKLCPYLGSYPQIKLLLEEQFAQLSAPGRILLSHGSRRPGANQLIEKLASQLGAKTAYWSMTPSLAAQIAHLAEEGCKQIAILPYFLFSGGITDAIAQQVRALEPTYPTIELTLGKPLGPTPALANLIAINN
ncbi:sirohydrochlorin chelatase [Gloeothece verrucosa]|uniref:Cobalamin (Vitamin B12) biosynthesis CbiX protein n=1 Tax=Gloeothece verrucosa (strain PCC 7822) TaxID=497965 RepID=E0UI78_GLOV7|nr:sirohydrochlorin chelatase [Gloeothece verrucosa]ADN15730.1 cobalamin (vitamin B12) biosynthesis CbiX protein [Gloeothece verrucosa PCC 7822]